jgi:hypothetical protein
MTKKILTALATLAIASGSIVSSSATTEAVAMIYNPTYCILFLPFLCFPPTPHRHGYHSHYGSYHTHHGSVYHGTAHTSHR